MPPLARRILFGEGGTPVPIRGGRGATRAVPLTAPAVVSMIHTMNTAKVFRTGRSQAVRIPKEYRFRDLEVAIRREGEAVILEPLRKTAWPKGFWRGIRIGDRAFVRPSQGSLPERRALDPEA